MFLSFGGFPFENFASIVLETLKKHGDFVVVVAVAHSNVSVGEYVEDDDGIGGGVESCKVVGKWW